MSISINRMTRSLSRLVMLAAAGGLVFACGGAGTPKRSGLGDDAPPPPPKQSGGDKGDKGDKEPARVISKNAREDYGSAVGFYKQQAESGWNRSTCESAADRFASVASEHPKLVEARYMVGRSYHNCDMAEAAEKQYQQVLSIDRTHALSLSNLGELYFQAGKIDSAKKYWRSAVDSDGKIAAARNNLAWLMIIELRTTKYGKQWKEIFGDAKIELSSSLAIDNDNAKTYVLYGLLYLEGSERNRNQLDLAKLLLDEGAKRDDKFAPLYNARGLLAMKRDRQSAALADFQKAVELDPSFSEARMNVGNITLGFRKYDVAEEQFTAVLDKNPDNYEAWIGLGVAQRGLNKLEDAENSYKKAIALDKTRGDAYFNLGVLYKDFLANKADDLKGSQDAYKEARTYFRKYVTKPGVSKEDKREADDNISDCDKIIRQLEDVMKAQAQAAAEAAEEPEPSADGAATP